MRFDSAERIMRVLQLHDTLSAFFVKSRAIMAKCSECGFFGLRRVEDGQIVEAPERVRETGEIIGINDTHERKPACSRRMRKFTNAECAETPALLNAIQQEYSCTVDTPWKPGNSPKEHEEMQLLREVEAKNRAAHQEIMTVVNSALEQMKAAATAAATAVQAATTSAEASARQATASANQADVAAKQAKQLEEATKEVRKIADELNKSGQQLDRHHIWNYILSGLAIICGLMGTLIAAAIAKGWIELPK